MVIDTGLRGGISLGALAIALGAFASPSAAFAQSADPERSSPTTGVDQPEVEVETANESEGEVDDEQSIVVQGFRNSLATAVAEKRDIDQIIESVSAEDIGKLPDASIGESIARLPGVTSQRLNGRSNNIAIRGFGPDFSQTLLNGREQTTTGDSRAVEFDQYPSEVVSQVVVYKTPTAALVGQGLVGTIDIRTIRPLDYGKSIFAIGGRGTYAALGALNAGSRQYGYRANATYVDQFADDTIGVALAAAYVDEPYQLQEFNAWGYAGGGTATDPTVIGGSKSYVTSTRLKRLGLNGTLQVQATDTLRMTLDGFYSNFNDDQSKRGLELPLAFGGNFDTDPFDPASGTVSNGFATSGRFTDVRGVVRNDVFQRKADLYSFGYNAAYEGEDGWNAFFDFGYSRTDRNELSIESYAGTGFNGDGGDPQGDGTSRSDTIGFTSGPRGAFFTPGLNYSDPTLIRLTDPLGWGGGTVPQAGYYNNRIIKDQLKQYRLGVSKDVEGFFSSFQVGLNYTNRDKSLTPNEAFVRLPSGVLQAAVPSQYLLSPTNLSYLGLGPIVSYDPRTLIANGVLVLEPRAATGPGAANDVLSKNYSISEDLMTAYLMANIDQEMGSANLTGNFGVQAVNTVQKSTGFIFPPTGPQQVTLGAEYWDVLPSLNLALRFDGGWVVRAAASRQIQRPRLDDLRVSIGYGIDSSVPGGIIRGGGGNPFLRPYRANAVDLNLEKYFGSSGMIAVQLFYKDIKSFIFNGRFAFDYSAFPAPSGAAGFPNLPATGTLDAPINTGGGSLYGGELAATLPFDTFIQALSGFGVTGGVGYTKSKVQDAGGNISTIPGYSEWVANGTAYFEKAGFNARGSVRYRSTFLGDFTGFGGTPTRRTALSELIVDAQIGYDFRPGSALEGLSIYIQGQNLTDERFASIANGNRLQVVDYQIYGRRFLAGATFKF